MMRHASFDPSRSTLGLRLADRTWRLLRVAATTVLALASCGAPSSDSAVTLSFWAFGREGAVVAELTRDFERLHPGIRVDVQQIPWRAAHEKLLTGYVGETLPDVAQLGNTWVPELRRSAPSPRSTRSWRIRRLFAATISSLGSGQPM
jgi:hypothetical protein